MLSERLKQLERLGVVTSAPKPDGRGHHYELTSAGHDLFKVCVSLGEWGARWLEIAPENLDPFVALWSMCNALRRDRLPDRRVVIRFDFTGRPHRERYWLLIELGDTEICKTCPGIDEDLYITADAEAFVKWHAGQLTWAQATRDGPHPTRRPPVAGKSLPNLERPQHVRPHQAGLPHRHEPRRLTSSMAASRPSRDPETSAVLADPCSQVGCPTVVAQRARLLPRGTRPVLAPRSARVPRAHPSSSCDGFAQS